jgi:tetratricopeptide (TPR) repeat protein
MTVYNDNIRAVRKLLRNKKYNEAKDLCQKFLNPRIEEICYRAFYGFYKICEAEIARENNKEDDAIKHYDEAIRSLNGLDSFVKDFKKALYNRYILKSEWFREQIDREDDEEKRMKYRYEMLNNAQETAKVLDPTSWKFFEVKGDEHKIACIIEKAKGEYTKALELLRDAKKCYEEAYKRKRDKTREEHLKYCEALEEEIFAQQEYLNGNIIKACEHYQKAAKCYDHCKDKISADWCRFLQFFLNGLVLLINPSGNHREGTRRLRQALEISPKKLLEEMESHRKKILDGKRLPEDKKLMAFMFPLALSFKNEMDQLFTKLGHGLESWIRGYLRNYEDYDEVPEEQDTRKIDAKNARNEKEKDLVQRFGVVEIDVIAYKRKEGELLVVEVTKENKPATKDDLDKFVQISEAFIERWKERERLANREIKKTERWFISINGFKKDAENFASESGIILFDKDELIKRMREHKAPIPPFI